MTSVTTTPKRSLRWRLYHGETAFDFIGRPWRWALLSGTVILIGLAALGVRGLNFGIDFKGGTSWEVPSHGVSVAAARDALRPIGEGGATVQTLQTGNTKEVRVEANPSSQKVKDEVSAVLAKLTHNNVDAVSVDSVGPTWGHDISQKAERALVFFLVAIFAFIWLRFSEWKMSVAALVALLHDILVTVGIYALFGFPVTPSTVVAFLTILGYSLYDTVVVFDKVDENTRGLAMSGRMTYSDTVNLSMNQVLMRSLNTSFVAILPILSVLLIGSGLLGAATLSEFGLALFVGLFSGAYSSIFIASPLLAILKEREQRYSAIRQRIQARGAAGTLITPAAAAAGRSAADSSARVDGSRGDAELATAGVSVPGGSAGRASRPGGAGGANRPRPRGAGGRPAPRGRKKGRRR